MKKTYVNFRSTVFSYASERRGECAVPFVAALSGPEISESMMRSAFRGFGCIYVASPSLEPLEKAAGRVRLRCADSPNAASIVILSADEPFPEDLRDIRPRAFLYVGSEASPMSPDGNGAAMSVEKGANGEYRFSILRRAGLEPQHLSDAAIAIALLLGARKVYRVAPGEPVGA